jgi:DNA polymerase alpha subunit A
LGEGSLQTQLEVQIRKHVARYYEGWLVCDDSVCGYRTRMMRVYGRKCLRPECRGTMSYEVSASSVVPSIFLTTLWSTTTYKCIISFCISRPCSTPRKQRLPSRGQRDKVRKPKKRHVLLNHQTPEAISALLQLNSLFLTNMTKLVDKYLVQCGRRWVDLKSIFSFMKI